MRAMGRAVIAAYTAIIHQCLEILKMNTYSEISANLEQLFEIDPGLAKDLDEALNIDQAVTLITESAGRHEVLMDAERLAGYLQAQIGPTEVSDAGLAGVSGGMSRAGKKIGDLIRKMRR